MVDLVGMQCENAGNGSIKLHQSKYIKKLLDRFLPDGPPSHVKPDCLPYTSALPKLIEEAITAKETNGIEHPELVNLFQQRCGAYLYLNTSTRPDIAYPVSQLCRIMSCPTPALFVWSCYLR